MGNRLLCCYHAQDWNGLHARLRLGHLLHAKEDKRFRKACQGHQKVGRFSPLAIKSDSKRSQFLPSRGVCLATMSCRYLPDNRQSQTGACSPLGCPFPLKDPKDLLFVFAFYAKISLTVQKD